MNSTFKECIRLTICAVAYVIGLSAAAVILITIYNKVLIPLGLTAKVLTKYF